jgi:nitroreductase
MKEILKRYLPAFVILQILRGFFSDFARYIKFTSSTKLLSSRSRYNIAAKIIALYHAIEKGICMPEFRYGFGNAVFKDLLDQLDFHIARYGYDYVYIGDALSVIHEYLLVHADCLELLDSKNVSRAHALQEKLKDSSSVSFHMQDTLEAAQCFKNVDEFRDFALSRRSYRYFDGTSICTTKLIEAVSIARYAPSSCNRQSAHVHIYTDKKLISDLLDLQGGSRGYGHLGDILLLVTSNIQMTIHVNERHMPYVDGGIFYMSLLFALHSSRIACCPLNCYFPPVIEKKVRLISGIKESEAIVAMIICGNISGTIKAVKSPRLPVDYFYTYH